MLNPFASDFNNAGPRYSERDGQPFLPPVSPPSLAEPDWKRESTHRSFSESSIKEGFKLDTTPILNR